MGDAKLLSKIADIPMAQPGFNALNMTAPMLVQLNPNGKWESSKPDSLDEERLKAVVQHLIDTKAVTAAQSYCCQCACENQTQGAAGSTNSNYVPVIMMPIYSADQCPFDMNCEIQKMKDSEPKQVKKTKKAAEHNYPTDAPRDLVRRIDQNHKKYLNEVNLRPT